uniref:Nucleotide-diphospho-sugar transferase domain-containing protein n=1 Tax=Chenopodium quinoa TaxID=63459 RepID=A0A803LNR6_CHEQI
MQLGDWSGQMDFTVAPMDEFSLVLGMDFLHFSKAVPMPHLRSILVPGQQPCLLRTCDPGKGPKGPLLSVMQLEKGLKRNEPTFLATLSTKEDEASGDFPPAVAELLSEFQDLLPKDLPKVIDEYYELRKVLEAASTKDKTVILTSLNEAWVAPNSMFDIFLESFKIGNNTAPLLDHLLAIAMDEKAYNRCRKLICHCYFLKSKQSSEMANEAGFMTPMYLEILWERLDFLKTILSLGYNFIFTDTDIMWFRNPFPHFTPDSDFQTSCDRFNGRQFDIQNPSNNGFLFVRSNTRTIKFYKFWVSSRHAYPPTLHEQDVFSKIKNGTYVRKLGVKFRFLDTNYFGGFCQMSRDFNKVCTMHANCCTGLDRKIADLNTTLEVWKNYMSSNHSIPTNWRVPNQCHM